jgi:hypothetical protein
MAVKVAESLEIISVGWSTMGQLLELLLNLFDAFTLLSSSLRGVLINSARTYQLIVVLR